MLSVFALAHSANAQAIDFETLPDGTPTTDQMLISDQYVADFGVRFDLVDPVTLVVVGSPQIAKVGSPRTAFSACGSDTPNPGQGVGDSFLTDDGTVSSNVETLLVTYTDPVAQAAGVILDTDTRSGSSYEEWTIDALDSSMNVLETVVITAPDGPDNCRAGQGPGDGAADSFVFNRGTADIKFIVLRYTGTASSIGLAFDSFSPTELPPPPVATLKAIDANPCQYDRVFLTPSVTSGLAPFTYQWQHAAPMQNFTDILNAHDHTFEAPAISGYAYRVVVTDSLTRQSTTSHVQIGAVRPVRTSLLVETAPFSGIYDTLATNIKPFIFDSDIETMYGWTNAEPYYHGPSPALTLDRSHLFLTVGAQGQSLVAVHDFFGSNSHGKAEMRMDFVGVTPDYTAKDDDTGDAYNGAGSSSLKVRSNWDSPNTDGWGIGPLEGTWTASTQFSDEFTASPTIEGLTTWAFYSADGSIYMLPLEENRIVFLDTICSCLADMNNDGTLDFFDISAFLTAFANNDPVADFTSDGTFDFFDISAFLSAFTAGCP